MAGEAGSRGNRQRLPWVVAAIAVAALVATIAWSRQDRQAVKDEALAQFAERLDALENAPAPPRGRPPAGRPLVLGGGDVGAMDALGQEPQTPEEIAAARDRQLRELEARFAADSPDPAGGPRTEDVLVRTISGETMAGTGLRPDNVDIACKQASCRIVGTFDRMGDAQDWSLFYITAAGGNVLSQTQMVFVPRPDGKTEVRIYSNRAGS